LEDQGVDGRIMLKWILERWDGRALTGSIGPVLVNAVINLGVSYNAGNFLSILGPVSFSGRTLLHGVS
jgi:hypothetical protein